MLELSWVQDNSDGDGMAGLMVTPTSLLVPLREVCGVRAGDKGNRSDLTLFADTQEVFEHLTGVVTAERVAKHFAGMADGPVERYLAPNVLAIKFVIDGALGGGGPLSLRSDNLGKTLGGALLRLRIEMPQDLLDQCPRYGRRAPLAQGWPIGMPALLGVD